MYFNRLNLKKKGVHLVEEPKQIINGQYIGRLNHSNVILSSIQVTTKPNKEGDVVVDYSTSQHSEKDWITNITIKHHTDMTVYVHYETEGDVVDADDVNFLQSEIKKVKSDSDTNKDEIRIIKSKLDEKPSVGDIVSSVNGEKGDVILDGKNIEYSSGDGQSLQDVIAAEKERLDGLSEVVVESGDSMSQSIGELREEHESLFVNNPDAKNSIYRGKNLGSEVTEDQYEAISSGSFDDLYIGDYWRINNINWRIAAFNYYKNTGDTPLTKNHVTIVPDTTLYNHKMNEEHKTEGGYLNSLMYTEGLEEAKTTIKGIFGEHLVNHRQMLTNATADGKSSGWAWVDSEVELMNEIMVYGASVFGSSDLGGGSGRNIGTGKSQLPLFSLNPQLINTRQYTWLRDVVSAAYFAIVLNAGGASCHGDGFAFGVRPAFSIS